MKCPQDVDVDLVMSERQGVEIDDCPSCRGVWLDRGELDKILDRAAALGAPSSSPAGHVSGEGGLGPAAGASTGYEGQPGGAGYGSGGYGVPGGYGGAGSGRYGEEQGRYADDRSRYGDDRGGYGDDRGRYGGDRDRDDDDHGRRRPGHDPRRKRKESWLGDLLDFG